MRVSDYRLSPSMKNLLVGLVTGSVSRNSRDFPASTAEALYKRGLVDGEFRPVDTGSKVAAELVSRMPIQFPEPELARLIAGLQIFQLYDPIARPYSTQRSGRCLSVQAEAFEGVTEEHRMTLNDLGWCQAGHIEWFF